jgi:hypothetical protein
LFVEESCFGLGVFVRLRLALFGLVASVSFAKVQSGKVLLLVRSGLSDTTLQFVHFISADEKIF